MGVLDGRVAIVTGAARGIGRGVAVALAREGARVAIADIRPADDTVAEIGAELAFWSRCDVRDSAQVDAFVAEVVARWGGVQVLVNNAMASRIAPLAELDDEAIALSLATGPAATLYLMRACYPHLKGDGRVINLRSGSELAPMPGFAAYVAGKAAVAAITRAAAREWGRDGITVNALAPFALSEAARSEFDKAPGMLDGILDRLSLPRAGDPERDIGRAAVYLAGPDAGYVTGCTLTVDGGGTFLS